MNSKMIAVIAVVAVLVVGGVVTAVVLSQKNNSETETYPYFDGVGLKVLGNVDKDNEITQADYDKVAELIESGASAADNKLADANNDGELTEYDLTIIKAMIEQTTTSIWHLNYHDVDGNGTMDKVLVKSRFPVTSAIMTGSANNFILFTLLGIPAGDVVKGANYSTTSNDKFLYSDTYLDKDKVTSLGTSSTTIEFENGKSTAASQLISQKNVTCLVTDWNRTYITNQNAFEDAGVDVVRVAAASFDKEDYTHTISLLGMMFKQKENAAKIVKLYDDTAKAINDALKDLPNDQKKKAVASSMTGALSSDGSDYTAQTVAAGAEFGLKGYNFGGSTSVYVASNKGVFDTREYNFDNIVHLRTALTYNSSTSDIAKMWSEYANAMGLWDKAMTGQVLVSGTIPIPCRVANIAYAIYHDTVPALDKAWLGTIMSAFESNYHIGSVDLDDAKNRNFAITGSNYAVTVDSSVEVRDKDNNLVASGTSFPYGTELSISAKVVDPNYTLYAENSTVKDGKFLVIDKITAKYVKTSILDAQAAAATKLVEIYNGDENNLKYIQNATANVDRPGSVQTFNVYTSIDSTRPHNIYFEYFETPEEALAKYNTYKDSASMSGKLTDKSYNNISKKLGDVGEISLAHSYKVHDTKNDYTSSTTYFVAYYKNVVLRADLNGTGTSVYQSIYSYDTSLYKKTSDELKSYWLTEATAFEDAIEVALKAGMGEA